MPAKTYTEDEYNDQKSRDGWNFIAEFRDDLEAFANFVNDPGTSYNQKYGPYAMAQVKGFFQEVEKAVTGAKKPGPYSIFLDHSASQCFVTLSMRSAPLLVWSCWKSEEQRRKHDVDGAGCLRTLAALAVGKRLGIRLLLPEQEDKSFMWKAPTVHPLQVLENTYQRIVQKAGHAAEDDAIKIKNQSKTLSEYFKQDPGLPECFKYRSLEQFDGEHLSAVKMNYLIETFYLLRLLVQYRVETDARMDETALETLRAELSSDLTKLLHNGDPAKMGWLFNWLEKKISDLGREVEALNQGGKKRVIFFLKGGRALNYFLGTPKAGENDWDTQIVIDPTLKAEEWYQCFREVHDVMLVALKTFKTEFTELVQQNSPQFAEYLKDKVVPKAVQDEEVGEAEAGDVGSLVKHANCKAELIDIGIPRRDSASALEEWTHLSSPDALLGFPNVIYPHREYYLNEYLMMVRDAFLPKAEVAKARKRIHRLGLILKSNRGRKHRQPLAVLPETEKKVAALPDRGRQELFDVILSQFVEAYNIHQDRQLAAHFDTECAAMISNPPKLIDGLATLSPPLESDQQVTATDIGIAHALSEIMKEHWTSRNEFFEQRIEFFDEFVLELARLTNQDLQKVSAQFAVAGSYAAHLQSRHIRLKPVGLEPIRRILVKLQCPQNSDRPAVMNAVRNTIKNTATGKYKLTVTDVDEGNKQSLLLYWGSAVPIGKYTYAPLVMKIRVAEQKGDQLPVLASINGIPVLDLRYLVADYLKKTSKIDERGSRRVLANATAAVSGMLSRFDFDSDSDDV